MSSNTSSKKMTGFLDGFMAGNISANATELKLHTDKMKSFLKDMVNCIVGFSDAGGEISLLKNSIQRFEDKPLTIDSGDNDEYYNYSVEFDGILSQIFKIREVHPFPTDVNYLIKRSIYHLLNIAKTLNDQRIIDIATKVAKEFEQSRENK